MEQQSTLSPGTILRGGAYRVERALSSGGFGNTYVVTNLNFNETWAMKEFFMKGINLRDGNTVTVSVPDNRPSFDAQREKFKKEAQRLWHLKNEHIVKVHDLFEENGTVYYAMDFIDGESLRERLKRLGRPLTEAETEPLLRQVLDALEAVHSQNIWHLDIKPDNMMVDKRGRLFLIDFGASKQLHNSEGLSVATSSALAFTPGYAPLEQTYQDFKLFGPWTDLYALGASLYKLLTMNTPPSASEIVAKDGQLQFPPVVSPRMQHLIAWMMNPAYMRRPQSAADVRQFLDTSFAVDEDATVLDQPEPLPEPPQKPQPELQPEPQHESQPEPQPEPEYDYEDHVAESKPRRGIIIAAVVAVLAVVGIAFVLLDGNPSESDSSFDEEGIEPQQEQTTMEEPQAEQPAIVKIPFTSTLGDRGQYTGPVDDYGKPHGSGIVTFENGNVYKGPFENGLMQGDNGFYVFQDGSKFNGTMKADHFLHGTFTAADGSYFQGEFDEKGQPKLGVWCDSNGEKIESVYDGKKI